MKSEDLPDTDIVEVAGPSTAKGTPRGGSDSNAGDQGYGDKDAICCPICQKHWPADSMTNAELNSHVDDCLSSRVA